MKHQYPQRSNKFLLIALMILGVALVGCDNTVQVGPTEPQFNFSPNVGALRTLQISGALESEEGSCLKATILFNGEEIDGARTRCPDKQGCSRLELSAVVSAPAGHHTITFEVLRQATPVDRYVAAGSVAVSRFDVQLGGPVILDLARQQAELQPGEGVTYDIILSD